MAGRSSREHEVDAEADHGEASDIAHGHRFFPEYKSRNTSDYQTAEAYDRRGEGDGCGGTESGVHAKGDGCKHDPDSKAEDYPFGGNVRRCNIAPIDEPPEQSGGKWD